MVVGVEEKKPRSVSSEAGDQDFFFFIHPHSSPSFGGVCCCVLVEEEPVLLSLLAPEGTNEGVWTTKRRGPSSS